MTGCIMCGKRARSFSLVCRLLRKFGTFGHMHYRSTSREGEFTSLCHHHFSLADVYDMHAAYAPVAVYALMRRLSRASSVWFHHASSLVPESRVCSTK
jgi:hypothetical protein